MNFFLILTCLSYLELEISTQSFRRYVDLFQSYPVTLQLTSVISKLALVPHPTLHEFLLDPYLPLVPGVRNLYTVLQKVRRLVSELPSDPTTDLCVSKLALVPHPTLHEFLLDPYLPLVPGVRNLYTVLQKVRRLVSELPSDPTTDLCDIKTCSGPTSHTS